MIGLSPAVSRRWCGNRKLRILFCSITAILCLSECGKAERIARIAVISNPYITKLPPKEIKDENGSVRDFLAATGPPSMKKTVELVNAVRPDALVVMGSLTWSGSDEDMAAFAEYFRQIKVPTHVVPGHRDRLSGSLDAYQRLFGKVDATNNVRNVNGVRLAFAGDLHTDPDAASARLRSQLDGDSDSAPRKGVLLFAARDRSMPRSKLTPKHEAFWKLVDDQNIAVQIEPTRYGHQIGYENTLPLWTVGSTAWSARGAITLIDVFDDHIELAEISTATERSFSLTVPNPVRAPRMKSVADDEFGCPSYSADLATKPDFSFALVSDPQFDRAKSREYLIQKAKAAIAELNRLNPQFVFVAGDLVNNNLPEEWELFNEIFASLKPPKHVVPGNHDVLFNYDFVEQSYSSAPEKNPEYAAIVKQALAAAKQDGLTGPAALYEKYTGSKPRQVIEHGNCAFITVPFLTTRADREQIDFLRRELERMGDKRHVFVVAHYPSLPAFGNNLQPKLGGTEVLSLLQEHRVTGYLFGHRHRNGFRMHERTAHVLTDNMLSIHLLHVFPDRVVVGRKRVGSPLYEKLTVVSPRRQ